MFEQIHYRRALIVESKAGGFNENGTPKGIRWSSTMFASKEDAKSVYGDHFIRLDDTVECRVSLGKSLSGKWM